MAQPASPNKKNCIKCYRIAKAADSGEIRALPGVLHVSDMIRLHKDLGRCQVCDGGKEVWHDPANWIAICDVCYHNHGKEAESCV